MEEDWDCESGAKTSEPAQTTAWNAPRLRGFGRGKTVGSTNGSTANSVGMSNGGGFGKPAGGSGGKGWVDDDDWDGSGSKGGFGKPPGGFGKPSGGFGKPPGGNDDTSPTNGFGGGRTGGFGGGFGGNKRGGDECHKCGESGHYSRDCPSGGGGSGGRGGGGRSCHKCGEEGHMARDCSNGGGGGFGSGGSSSGFGGGFGAPTKADGSKFGGSGFGSAGNDDGSKRGGFGRGGGGFGDGGAPSGGGGGGGFGGTGCRKCGEEGHYARECPSGGGGPGAGGGACHKCGEEGHYARECPKALADGEKPREIYVPPTMDDAELFNEGIHQGINFDKYDNIDVEVTGSNKLTPIMAFKDAGLLPMFLKNVQRAGYTKPTPIQKHAIPSIMAGRDIMACAQTGSGKTAAFILPVLTGMMNAGLSCSPMSEVQEPQTIVVAPTRELADQIFKEARKFSMHTDLRCVVVYGGTSVMHQLRQVENGANLVVGTPGRLLDFIERGKIGLRKVKYLILDEADRMLDMGFEPSIRKLVDTLGMPPKSERQTLMFSATFKPDIQRLAADFMRDYLFITVGIVGGACTDVEQTFLEVDRLQKREYLCDILNKSGTNRVLVFVGQKRNADFLASFLSQSGYPTTTIHGDRLQREREEALRDFKSGKSPVLIATNVAARGLDIPDVTHVVNYDLPQDIDEYVHRIGRTGRCGNLGKATSFYNHDTDSALTSSLVKILSEARQEVPGWLDEYSAAGGGGGGGFSGRFASKDIRRKKFDNGDDFGNGGGGGNQGFGGNYGATAVADDDESWD